MLFVYLLLFAALYYSTAPVWLLYVAAIPLVWYAVWCTFYLLAFCCAVITEIASQIINR